MDFNAAPSGVNEPTIAPSKEQLENDDITEIGTDDDDDHYDAMASVHATIPSEIARAAWMKEVVEMHKGWIGFEHMGNNIKALDYCAGTGFFSQALAPYVHRIFAVNSAQNMTIEYNKIAEQTKEAHPNCEMRAFWGDLMETQEPKDEPWATDGVGFDLIAMSLAINYFACSCCGIPGLQDTLRILTSRLNRNGTLLVLDIQKDYAHVESAEGDIGNPKLRNGKKLIGFGSEEVTAALKGLGMEGIAVLEDGDLRFRFEKVVHGEAEIAEEVYYMLKAKRG